MSLENCNLALFTLFWPSFRGVPARPRSVPVPRGWRAPCRRGRRCHGGILESGRIPTGLVVSLAIYLGRQNLATVVAGNPLWSTKRPPLWWDFRDRHWDRILPYWDLR